MQIDTQIQKQFEEIDRKAKIHLLQHHIDMLRDNIKCYFPQEAKRIVISIADSYNCPLYAVDVDYITIINGKNVSATERLILQQYNDTEYCFCTTYIHDVPEKYAKYSYMAGFTPKLLNDEYIYWNKEDLGKLIATLKGELK